MDGGSIVWFCFLHFLRILQILSRDRFVVRFVAVDQVLIRFYFCTFFFFFFTFILHFFFFVLHFFAFLRLRAIFDDIYFFFFCTGSARAFYAFALRTCVACFAFCSCARRFRSFTHYTRTHALPRAHYAHATHTAVWLTFCV